MPEVLNLTEPPNYKLYSVVDKKSAARVSGRTSIFGKTCGSYSFSIVWYFRFSAKNPIMASYKSILFSSLPNPCPSSYFTI